MECPYCSNSTLRQDHRSLTNPVKDIFWCPECDRKFYRYQDTYLERPGDTRMEEYHTSG